MMKEKNTAPDIIVVGGGPAGMMAAGRAAELGANVTLAEKTYRLGSKLLLTGGGRCNITNTAGTKDFVAAFGKNGRFLYRALAVLPNRDLIDFFESRGVEMRADPDGKVFPAQGRAEGVLAALRKYLEENKVRILHNTPVTALACGPDNGATKARGVRTESGEILAAAKVILAAGGLSYPDTGSSGDGYALARQCGHSIVPPRPALVALESDEPFIRQLQGLALKDIRIALVVDGKTGASREGDLLFTHFGVSGPPVLILSGAAVDALAAGSETALSLELRRAASPEEFDRALQKELESCGPKSFSGYLKGLLPASLSPVFEKRCGVAADKKCSMISREERKRIAASFTSFRVHLTRPRPIEEATVTQGGVALDEINPQTMGSRKTGGLYLCGEMIDLAGITGGYNLQEAFSTGFLAGESAARSLR
ncbi:MAG: BaiN/RdsA family NAD(P)/FAD-dependent oxidoreductase [Endomicrobiales bacterium]